MNNIKVIKNKFKTLDKVLNEHYDFSYLKQRFFKQNIEKNMDNSDL